MSLNEFNRWAGLIWAKGFADGQDMLSEEVIVEIGEEDLLRTVMSVKGIGEKRANLQSKEKRHSGVDSPLICRGCARPVVGMVVCAVSY